MNNQNYAIAEIAGDQVILEPGKNVAVPKMDLEVGAKFLANKILFIHTGNDIKVGKPYLADFAIETTVLEHKRNSKVLIFKKKRRKGYRVKKGHRQPYTVLQVSEFAKPEAAAPVKKSRAKTKTITESVEPAEQEKKE
ncbi:MAG: 50S ribosomal protein L21 [Candidatus Marinimicrobia bacterium ADurb.Bin030]|nr:MAG: 50S ribosomal protein L21 [Candidatus Marinimicrobia bacterium ADurb.Bin030]